MAERPIKPVILVPVDFSPTSKTALLEACELALCLKNPIVVLHVVHDPGAMPSYYANMVKKKHLVRIEDAAQEMFDSFMATVIKENPELKLLKKAQRMLVTGIPVTRILQVGEKVNARMVVMGSRGLTGLQHVMQGSVAQQVVQLCPIPVTVVKAEK